jgi:hypothetical protein
LEYCWHQESAELWLTLLAKASTEKEPTATTFLVSFATFHMTVRKEVGLAHELLREAATTFWYFFQ